MVKGNAIIVTVSNAYYGRLRYTVVDGDNIDDAVDGMVVISYQIDDKHFIEQILNTSSRLSCGNERQIDDLFQCDSMRHSENCELNFRFKYIVAYKPCV